LNGTSVPRENCPLNKTTYTRTSTLRPIDSAWLGEIYGQSDNIGTVGYEDVQIGSITLSQQELGFMNATLYGVDSAVSGILGLANPILSFVCLHRTCLNEPALIEIQVHPSSYHLSNSSTLTKAELDEQYLSDRISYPTVMKRTLGMDITYFSMALERTPFNQETGFGKSQRNRSLSIYSSL
jgi:hypothetical protein